MRRPLQYLALACYIAFLGFPLLWLAGTALKGPAELAGGGLVPVAPTLVNFGDAVARADLVTAATNSLVVALGTTALVLVLALPAAYALARYRTRLKMVANVWVLVSQVFPVILVIVPLFLILRQFRLVDSLVGLTLVHAVYALPFALWMLQGFIATIPRDVEEAGVVDGAGRVRVLVSIVAPLLAPGLVATAMFTMISSWNEFFFALVLIQDPAKVTLPLTLSRFLGAEGQVQLGALAAGALLATVPSLLFFAAIQRRLTSGLLSGAVDDPGLLDVARDRGDVALQHPQRERQRVDRVHERQPDEAVDQPELAQDEEERHHHEDHREHLAHQHPAVGHDLQPGAVAGQRVRGGQREHEHERRGAERDDQAVRRGRDQVSAPHRVAEVLERGGERHEPAGGQLGGALESGAEQPEQREPEEDQVTAEREVLQGAPHDTLRSCARR